MLTLTEIGPSMAVSSFALSDLILGRQGSRTHRDKDVLRRTSGVDAHWEAGGCEGPDG